MRAARGYGPRARGVVCVSAHAPLHAADVAGVARPVGHPRVALHAVVVRPRRVVELRGEHHAGGAENLELVSADLKGEGDRRQEGSCRDRQSGVVNARHARFLNVW